MGEQNRNSGSMHDRTVYQRKKSEKWELKGLKPKNVSCSIMDRRQTALDMGYTVGEHEKRRYGTHRFGTGKGMCYTVSRRIQYGYLGFYKVLFYTYPSQRLPEVRLFSRSSRTSCLSNAINRLCVGMLLSFHPRSIKVSLPSLYSQRCSCDKIFQAFHTFCTASDKSCAEAWERG